jgi:drug/metabolite transporter superfamily protein YnfA
VIWLVAALDAATGIYLLSYAYRRGRRDKPGVLTVGVLLVVCSVLLTGLALWQTQQDRARPGHAGRVPVRPVAA